MKGSRARKRYERQGLLVEPEAMEKAYSECMLDENVRLQKREKAAKQRAKSEKEYVKRFAQCIREMYPNCPAGVEFKIARRACEIHSGRVGRTSFAKEFHPHAIQFAVNAHIRHQYTDYDLLMIQGWDRFDALENIRFEVKEIIAKWMGD